MAHLQQLEQRVACAVHGPVDYCWPATAGVGAGSGAAAAQPPLQPSGAVGAGGRWRNAARFVRCDWAQALTARWLRVCWRRGMAPCGQLAIVSHCSS